MVIFLKKRSSDGLKKIAGRILDLNKSGLGFKRKSCDTHLGFVILASTGYRMNYFARQDGINYSIRDEIAELSSISALMNRFWIMSKKDGMIKVSALKRTIF